MFTNNWMIRYDGRSDLKVSLQISLDDFTKFNFKMCQIDNIDNYYIRVTAVLTRDQFYSPNIPLKIELIYKYWSQRVIKRMSNSANIAEDFINKRQSKRTKMLLDMMNHTTCKERINVLINDVCEKTRYIVDTFSKYNE